MRIKFLAISLYGLEPEPHLGVLVTVSLRGLLTTASEEQPLNKARESGGTKGREKSMEKRRTEVFLQSEGGAMRENWL